MIHRLDAADRAIQCPVCAHKRRRELAIAANEQDCPYAVRIGADRTHAPSGLMLSRYHESGRADGPGTPRHIDYSRWHNAGAVGAAPQTVTRRFTDVFVRRDGHWFVVAKVNRATIFSFSQVAIHMTSTWHEGEIMAEEALLTIILSKSGDNFRADLQAPSGINGVADLRLRGIGPSAVEAIEVCLAELQAKAADGHEIALRFA